MATTSTGKRIGFVDKELGNFHSNVFAKVLSGDLKARGYTVTACTSLDHVGGRAWAQTNGIPYITDAGEMDGEVDCYMVLSPRDADAHWELCARVIPFGKPTYVDKVFAPDLATAERIFALADRHHVPLQTTSALRYTNVQAHVATIGRDAIRHMITWGNGKSFGEYAIHPVELLVSCMGPEAARLMRRGEGRQSQLLIDFSGGRTGVVNVYVESETPSAASITTDKGTVYLPVAGETLFRDTASAILDFFEKRTPTVPRAESLAVRRILDAAELPSARSGFVAI
jgi:predicted dehydrogenase